jgi:hypothetical protein
MKCLQKDPAKRFQSVGQVESAIWKAVKARRVSSKEATLNRFLVRAEFEIRKWSGIAAIKTRDFRNSENWRILRSVMDEPRAKLGVTGMVGVLAVMALLGGWKSRTVKAQPIPAARQIFTARPEVSYAETGNIPTQKTLNPIVSHEVDLYRDSQPPQGELQISDASSPNGNAPLDPGAPAVSPNPIAGAKREKSPLRIEVRKIRAAGPSATQLQARDNQAPSESLKTPDAVQIAALDSNENLSRPGAGAVPAPAAVQADVTTSANAAGMKTSKLYFEVGTFKDESWAKSASEKLTQLGYQAVVVHKKNLLRLQSYHVEVGPYFDPQESAAARESLISQGFKPHPAN